MTTLLRALFAAFTFAIIAAPASAQLIAYEGMDYPTPGDLLQKNGGFGWGGAWQPGGFNASFPDAYDIASPSLDYPLLIENGNRATTGAANVITGISRPLASPIPAAQTTTRFLSVLLRQQNTSGVFNGFFGVYLDGGGINDDDVYIGKPGGGQLNRWVVETRGGAGQVAAPDPVVPNQTTLLVLRGDFRPGADTFSLWVDPNLITPGIPPPEAVKSDLDIGQVNGLVIYSGGAFSVDEIRWGNTFFDVVPIPEPGSIALRSHRCGRLRGCWISQVAPALVKIARLRSHSRQPLRQVLELRHQHVNHLALAL